MLIKSKIDHLWLSPDKFIEVGNLIKISSNTSYKHYFIRRNVRISLEDRITDDTCPTKTRGFRKGNGKFYFYASYSVMCAVLVKKYRSGTHPDKENRTDLRQQSITN